MSSRTAENYIAAAREQLSRLFAAQREELAQVAQERCEALFLKLYKAEKYVFALAPLRELHKLQGLYPKEGGEVAAPQGSAAGFGADPVAFAEQVLGLRPWRGQKEVAAALLSRRRAAVRSGHKIGKSTIAAALALWWVSDAAARPGARVVITAPTARQVKSIVWKEIRRLYQNAERLGRSLGGDCHKDPANGLQFSDGREIVGLSTDEPEKLQGYSGAHLLFIIDEASGVPAEIYEAIEGNRAAGAWLLLLGNPTRLSGEFFDAFHGKARLYGNVHLSSEETPNVTGDGEPIPGLASREWVEEKREEWGEDDDRYLVRVRGEFPRAGSRSVISLALVEAAEERGRSATPSGRLVFGLDPARYGDDDSVLSAVQGSALLGQWRLRKGDGPTVAGEALQKIRELRAALGVEEHEKTRVNVDPIGVGASVFDCLRAEERELMVCAVNAAGKPPEHQKDDYVNLRDALWFNGRRWLKEGGALLESANLRADLTAPEYEFRAPARAKVESKEETKKRLNRSPDWGDSFLLAIWESTPEAYESARPTRRRR